MNIRSLMRIVGADCAEADAEKAAAAAEDYIRAYCGLCDLSGFPERIVLSMAAALLTRTGANGGGTPTNVKSVKVGDTEVDFGAAEADAALAILEGYNRILNRYRRVRWF
ncbi:MAG: hypothetical protein IJL26_06775 [Clostridia bacterium]|nr:hypothetical protein [Clostridia bacterium]